MPKKDINIFWFRQDLRLLDNPGLYNSIKNGATLPIFIFDDENSKEHINGSASKWWLHQSLIALKKSLDNNLSLYKGDPKKILIKLTETYNVKEIYWNRCYEPWRIKRDKQIKSFFEDKKISVNTFNGSLLWEPWNVVKNDGTPYKVFTPYYRKGCLNSEMPRTPIQKPKLDNLLLDKTNSISIDDLELMPENNWYDEMEKLWTPGEKGANNKIDIFIKEGLTNYKDGRNFPSGNNVSQLSPHYI
jgi:Deoxyribodipyrimidine photolyase